MRRFLGEIRPPAHSAPRLSPALLAPPLCRCAERTADLILQAGWAFDPPEPMPRAAGEAGAGGVAK